MAVGQKEVAVCFQADQRSAGMPYRPVPSHFEPWPQVIPLQFERSRIGENAKAKWQLIELDHLAKVDQQNLNKQHE